MYGKSERFEDYDLTGAGVVAMALDLVAGARRRIPASRRGRLFLLESGAARFDIACGHWVAAAGTALWLPGRAHGEIVAKDRCRVMVAFVGRAAIARLGSDTRRVASTPLLRALVAALAEIPTAMANTSRPRLLGRLLPAELRAATVGPIHLPMPQDRRLRALCQCIVQSVADRLPLSTAAADTGMSMRSLSRRFVAQTGMTVAQWQRHARLVTALTEVASGSLLYDAAAASGFGSASSLCGTFRRVTGTTLLGYFQNSADWADFDESRFFGLTRPRLTTRSNRGRRSTPGRSREPGGRTRSNSTREAEACR